MTQRPMHSMHTITWSECIASTWEAFSVNPRRLKSQSFFFLKFIFFSPLVSKAYLFIISASKAWRIKKPRSETGEGQKGAHSFGCSIVKEVLDTKATFSPSPHSIPLSPSLIHFLQGCTERRRKGRGGWVREEAEPERKLGKKKKKQRWREGSQKHYQRAGAATAVGNRSETDGGGENKESWGKEMISEEQRQKAEGDEGRSENEQEENKNESWNLKHKHRKVSFF